MKFSSSLKFNAVAEWWDEYIAYDSLKKHIYQLERQQVGLSEPYQDIEANENTALMHGREVSSTDARFIPLLDQELEKINLFYNHQEKELAEEVHELQQLIEKQEDMGTEDHHSYQEEYEDDEDEEDGYDFDPHSPAISRESTLPRSAQRRLRSRSESAGVRNMPTTTRQPPSHQRRYSISSNEDHGDLEASLLSLRSTNNEHPVQLSSPTGTGTGRGTNPSRSPIRAARTLATKIFMRDSVTLPDSIWTSQSNYAMDVQFLFKRKITNVYLTATSLKSFVELNLSGFRKILKKYDKVTESNLRDHYMHEVVELAKPFVLNTKDKLTGVINGLVELYAKCVTRGDLAEAKRQLKLHQREHIAWERDTVWRQMIANERRGDGEVGGVRALGGSLVIEEENGLLDVQTPAGHFKLRKKHFALVVSIVTFIVLLNVQVVEGLEANRCFAILIVATILWATEAIPLFVTSMLIPLLLVCFRVIRSNDNKHTQLSTKEATSFVFSTMFSPTIMLLIGGFTIASALSKTNIDRVLVTRVLSLAGSRPSTVLLAFMGVACFASMWISNVAAPTLCFALIRPILRTLPPRSKFAPCLILGIALAANIGGQSSPISSPQNLIALEEMDPKLDWASWFAVAIPVSFISVILIWLLLLVSYKPSRSPDGEGEIEIRPIRAPKDRFTFKQYWVSLVCIGTIILWCVEHSIEHIVGDMGIIAIIPVVAFFGTGVLKKEDFEQFLWTVVFLAMGGIALGKGVTSSGLLDVMDEIIRRMIHGLTLYPVVVILSFIILVVSTFISHTIASVLLVPIAKAVAGTLPGHHENLLIFLTALICSTGMGMPVSGFPNQTAKNQEDDMGQLYLSNYDFFKNGVPASIIATLVVSTVGYSLMLAIGL